jgi:hypothetical protein
MRMGFTMRQQAVAACYAKVLRLNSSSIADISAGKVLAHAWQPCKVYLLLDNRRFIA